MVTCATNCTGIYCCTLNALCVGGGSGEGGGVRVGRIVAAGRPTDLVHDVVSQLLAPCVLQAIVTVSDNTTYCAHLDAVVQQDLTCMVPVTILVAT